MQIPIGSIIHHLHECSFGALGTQSQHIVGFPFVTVLPFAPDERHRPVFLMSRLAEHTKNLLADPRASFLVFKPKNGDVLAGERLTILGEIKSVVAEEDLTARYQRYHPESDDYRALADFSFFRLEPQAIRMIGGFGQMGWSDATAFLAVDTLDLKTEATLIRELTTNLPPDARMLGIDRFGFDVEVTGRRKRERFGDAPLEKDSIERAVRYALKA